MSSAVKKAMADMVWYHGSKCIIHGMILSFVIGPKLVGHKTTW